MVAVTVLLRNLGLENIIDCIPSHENIVYKVIFTNAFISTVFNLEAMPSSSYVFNSY